MDTSKMSPEELLELLGVLERVKRLPELPLPEVRPEALVRRMESHAEKVMLTRVKTGARKKQHWKEKKRKQRERMRPYMAMKYREEKLPKRMKLVEDGDWWGYYLMEWKKRGYKIDLTKEEWNDVVAPHLKADRIPTLYRLNTAKPVAMHNILIKDGETKEVLFDGQEWLLNRLGVTLSKE